MHVPDGFFDPATAAAAGAVAAAGVAVALRRAGTDLDDRRIPLAGLTAAYLFVVQLLNFPVGLGTSGHLVGGALAAVLVGPWVAVLCLTVVLGVQALVFADGGITALGVNVVLLALVSVFAGWAGYRGALAVLPRRWRAVPAAAAVGAWLSLVAASVAFVGLYAVGGAAEVSLPAVAAAMVGVHAVIGVGEAVITALTVSAIVASRPDLLHRPARSGRGAGATPAATGVRSW